MSSGGLPGLPDMTVATPVTHTLDLPDVSLHYEVRGSGPLLVITGSPMAARFFGPLADALAEEHTVVTHDPRGISASVLVDPEQDSTPELRADDLAALIRALGATSADVFGSSGGAVTGLALAARHPHLVSTLVAHEPPVMELLPDVEEQRAATDDIIATFHRDGPGPAFMKFMAYAGFDSGDEGAPAAAPEAPSPQDMADGARFLGHELLGTSRFVPDIAALTGSPARILVGLGEESGSLLTDRTSRALAERLGVAPTMFPSDHGGFMDVPAAFAERLEAVLREE